VRSAAFCACKRWFLVGQSRRARNRSGGAADGVDDRRDGDLRIGGDRRDGERQRRTASGADEVKLQERDEGGHDDRPDYRE